VTAASVILTAVPCALSQGPCVLAECIAVNIKLVLTVFNEGAGNVFLWLIAHHSFKSDVLERD
jgi:hypothetical protein